MMKRALFALVAVSLLVGCTGAGPSETQERIVSPDGKWQAEVISSDCGQVTCALVLVNVRPISRKAVTGEDNVFVADNLHNVDVTWKDNSTLLVKCWTCHERDVETKEINKGPIKVLYDLYD